MPIIPSLQDARSDGHVHIHVHRDDLHVGARGVGSPQCRSVVDLPDFDVRADVTRRNDFFLGFFRIRTAAVACILRCS